MVFDRKIALFDVEAADRDEALRLLADEFVKADVVREDFLDGLMNREAVFPTGLILDNMGVAIPHTDPEYVKQTQLGFMRLANPVTFQFMGDPSVDVEVNMIFMMAIKESHGQVEMLSKLMDLFGDNDLMEQFREVKDFDSFFKLIEEKGLDI